MGKRESPLVQPVYVRTYVHKGMAGCHGLRWWVHRTPALQEATPKARAEAIKAARALRRAMTAKQVGQLLHDCGIHGMPLEAVRDIRKLLAVLRIPRLETVLGQPRDWPSERLRRLLPEVMAAADGYFDLLAAQAVAGDAARGGGNAEREAVKPWLVRLAALIAEAEQVSSLLPVVPRQFALWHDDARTLASVLADRAESAGLQLGFTRNDGRGVQFVVRVLELLGIAGVTGDAMAALLNHARREN
jgi:hypothetical protein